MIRMLILRWCSACLLCLGLPLGVAAQGLDETYSKAIEHKPWSQRFAERVGYQSGFSKSYALVVGISEFDHYDDLPTQNDPLKVRDFLIDAGFDAVHVLTEEKVTLARLRALMVDDFPSKMDANDRFVLYWSGHGVERDNTLGGQTGYLPLAQSDKGRYSTMASMDDINRWDTNLPGRHVLYLIDACFSGLAGVARQSTQSELLVEQMLKPARFLLTAGAAEEQTIASDQWGGSLFTYSLLSGLEGAADTSTQEFSSDGVISLFELISHIKKRVAVERNDKGWNKSITPQLRDMRGSDGEFFFLADPVNRAVTTSDELVLDATVVPQSQTALPTVIGSRPDTELPADPQQIGDSTMNELDKKQILRQTVGHGGVAMLCDSTVQLRLHMPEEGSTGIAQLPSNARFYALGTDSSKRITLHPGMRETLGDCVFFLEKISRVRGAPRDFEVTIQEITN